MESLNEVYKTMRSITHFGSNAMIERGPTTSKAGDPSLEHVSASSRRRGSRPGFLRDGDRNVATGLGVPRCRHHHAANSPRERTAARTRCARSPAVLMPGDDRRPCMTRPCMRLASPRNPWYMRAAACCSSWLAAALQGPVLTQSRERRDTRPLERSQVRRPPAAFPQESTGQGHTIQRGEE